jgi:hypothetical protein
MHALARNQLPTRKLPRGFLQSIRPRIPNLRLVHAVATLALSLFPWSTPLRAQAPASDSTTTLTALVYNYVQLPPGTLAAGQRVANQILAAAGARADWIDCGSTLPRANPKDLCQNGWTPQTPALRFISGANKHRQVEFGHPAIPVLTTIYYEKITRRAQRDNLQPRTGHSAWLRHRALTWSSAARRTRPLRHRHHATRMGKRSDPSSSDRQFPVYQGPGRAHPKPDPHPGESSAQSSASTNHSLISRAVAGCLLGGQGRTAARSDSSSVARPLGVSASCSDTFLSGVPPYTWYEYDGLPAALTPTKTNSTDFT